MWKLAGIELWGDSIEAFWMDGFKLRSIDTPLIRRDLQPVENGRQGVVDVSAFVAANDTTGPVDQCEVFLEAEQNAALKFVCQPSFEWK